MIAVLGPRGRLGSQLVSMGCTPVDVDITKEFTLPESTKVVINCAAYTNVDSAETEDGYEQAKLVNFWGVKNATLACLKPKARLIQISTDYVFGGKYGPYEDTDHVPKEDDVPVNYYGLTKLAAEAAVYPLDNVTVVRTTGLYGSAASDAQDLLKTVLHYAERGEPFWATHDLYGNQTYIPHLAEALIVLAERLCAEPLYIPKVLHIASRDVCTRYQFAQQILRIWGFSSLLVPVSSKDIHGWVARRPVYGGLIPSLDLPIYTIEEGLHRAHENWNRHPTV